MLFKNENLKKEWSKLNMSVKVIIKVIDCILAGHDMQVLVTCVFRSVEDNKKLYESLKKPVIPSLHSYWLACDFVICDLDGKRVDMSEDLVDEILDINARYPYGNGKHKSVIFHDGTELHFHVQQPLA